MNRDEGELDAVVAGYLGLDLLPRLHAERRAASFGELFRPGALLEVGPLDITLGGAVANTGLALQRFGRRVILNGLVGRDRLGDIATALLAEYGAADGIRRADNCETAYSVVIAPPGLDRLFLESPGCNRLFAADHVDFKAVARSRVFHCGYPPLMDRLYADGGQELTRIFSTARAHGAATSLDMSLPDPDAPSGKLDWAAYLARVLPCTDIFVPSAEELLFMLHPARYAERKAAAAAEGTAEIVSASLCAELAQTCLRLGARIVMVKNGAAGLHLAAGDCEPLTTTRLRLNPVGWSRRAMHVAVASLDTKRVVNACGAGDAAIGGFLAALLDGADMATAGAMAAIAGRDSLYSGNALDGLRDWSAMERERNGSA